MKKILAIGLCLLACGCMTLNRYIEGSALQLGAYIPVSGEIVGLEMLNYINGVKVTCNSNRMFSVTREYCSTNSYFKIVDTVEHVKTTVDVK